MRRRIRRPWRYVAMLAVALSIGPIVWLGVWWLLTR